MLTHPSCHLGQYVSEQEKESKECMRSWVWELQRSSFLSPFCPMLWSLPLTSLFEFIRKAGMVTLSDITAANGFMVFSGVLPACFFFFFPCVFFSDRQGANGNWEYFTLCLVVLPKSRALGSTEWALWETGLGLYAQLHWDLGSGSSVGQVTREGYREQAQGHHVHPLAPTQTMWNLPWDQKMPDMGNLESVASRFPGPRLCFFLCVMGALYFLSVTGGRWPGVLEVKKKKSYLQQF